MDTPTRVSASALCHSACAVKRVNRLSGRRMLAARYSQLGRSLYPCPYIRSQLIIVYRPCLDPVRTFLLVRQHSSKIFHSNTPYTTFRTDSVMSTIGTGIRAVQQTAPELIEVLSEATKIGKKITTYFWRTTKKTTKCVSIGEHKQALKLSAVRDVRLWGSLHRRSPGPVASPLQKPYSTFSTSGKFPASSIGPKRLRTQVTVKPGLLGVLPCATKLMITRIRNEALKH